MKESLFEKMLSGSFFTCWQVYFTLFISGAYLALALANGCISASSSWRTPERPGVEKFWASEFYFSIYDSENVPLENKMYG